MGWGQEFLLRSPFFHTHATIWFECSYHRIRQTNTFLLIENYQSSIWARPPLFLFKRRFAFNISELVLFEIVLPALLIGQEPHSPLLLSQVGRRSGCSKSRTRKMAFRSRKARFGFGTWKHLILILLGGFPTNLSWGFFSPGGGSILLSNEWEESRSSERGQMKWKTNFITFFS